MSRAPVDKHPGQKPKRNPAKSSAKSRRSTGAGVWILVLVALLAGAGATYHYYGDRLDEWLRARGYLAPVPEFKIEVNDQEALNSSIEPHNFSPQPGEEPAIPQSQAISRDELPEAAPGVGATDPLGPEEADSGDTAGEGDSPELSAAVPDVSAAEHESSELDGLAAEAAVDAAGNQDEVVESTRVNFDFNSARLTAGARIALGTVVESMEQNPRLAARVAGYSDSFGASDYNWQLSRQRAESVAGYLVNQGVSPERLIVEGRGVYPGDSDSGLAEDRDGRWVQVTLELR